MARTIAKDHDAKRGQIVSCAAKIFAEQGFDRASMNQVAREVGISKANIYHYYGSKDAILYDLLDGYLQDLRDEICGKDDPDLPPETRLHQAVARILLAYQGADNEHKVQIGAMSALPEDQQRVLRGYQRDMVTRMSDILAAVAPEVFAQDAARLRATTMSVFGMLNWYYMWNGGAGTQAREDYARLVTDLTLNGLRGL
ncbi:TetR/AcrR family transcriptional regulator [Pseudoponticoccus marisrubri]|uniref:TetR family transcriptional regulator n=1 Tax=Pseudoponticoccus marisrubri TaxID=1685382 RepID=A0A0W7WKJ4_9RHOB|nr:TetR/AcrR family transcriptional regulator [Pseudoponticoccus marisrubri]KUF11122.1 TetR family transcriptional regulator [Pseudoponticoccus marisrubri]